MRPPLPLLLLSLAACSGSSDAGLSPLAVQGERVYQNVCIACHNGDPTQDGSLGPAVAGSSQELVYARVVRGEYPPGYTPKRPGSKMMPRFEYLEPQVPAIAAYLDEVAAPRTAQDGGS